MKERQNVTKYHGVDQRYSGIFFPFAYHNVKVIQYLQVHFEQTLSTLKAQAMTCKHIYCQVMVVGIFHTSQIVNSFVQNFLKELNGFRRYTIHSEVAFDFCLVLCAN